ncbi:MAG: MFS transporter [Chloroflexota bacterium]|nr:MFS transporter [Dehalococcoidia bacterium]MDW8254962.1 MFS transporter [Chloroflexota bacterium]
MTTETQASAAGTALSPRWWLPLLIAGVGSFVSAIGFGAAGLALPRIAETFQVDLVVAQWVPLLQNVVMTSALLPAGWLADRIGNRRAFAMGTLCYAAGSLASALAPNFVLLLGARVVVIIGTALATATSPAITVSVVPPTRRGQALGWTVTFTYVGLAVGPALGGIAMTFGDWPAAFWFVVPFALAVAVAAARWLPGNAPHRTDRSRFDTLGALLLTAASGALLLAFTQGPVWGWTSLGVAGLIGAGVAAAAGFIVRELQVEAPLLDLRLFRSRVFASANASAVFLYLGGWVPPFLMPFFLIDGQGVGAAQAGLLLSIIPLTTMVSAPAAGTLADRWGSRGLTATGVGLVTAGLAALGAAAPEASPVDLAWRLALVGVGIGLFTTPNNAAALSAVPERSRATAAALAGATRNIGMAVGVALAGTVYAEATRLTGGAEEPFLAIRWAFWAVAGVTAIGIAVSLLRGRH